MAPRRRPPSLRVLVGSDAEPVHFLAAQGAYHGLLPAWYDAASIDAARLLEQRAGEIIEEAVAFVDGEGDGALRTNFTPGSYRDPAWRTINLSTDGLRYHRNRRRLPVTTAICESLPGFSSAQLGVLEPGCRLTEHHGDTNVMYRLHLAIEVPGSLPDVGISVAGQERSWVRGEVLAFEDAHLHTVWNLSDRRRIVLMVDVVKEELRPRRRWLMALAGAGILVQILDNRSPAIGRLGPTGKRALHVALAVPVVVLTPLQRTIGGAGDRWGPRRRARLSR